MTRNFSSVRQPARYLLAAILLLSLCKFAPAQTAAPLPKLIWKSVEFAIVKFNDAAPNSWNMYHTDRKGVLLVRLSKRYLLVNVQDEEVYDIDPQTVLVKGDTVEWSYSDKPPKPIDIVEWTDRNVGRMQRIRFRLSKNGHMLELQIPLDPVGKPLY
jgi:hypothetical protein